MNRTSASKRPVRTRRIVTALVATFLVTTSVAHARVYCAPRAGADGQTVIMCGVDPRDGLVTIDECQAPVSCAECRTQAAMFCYAEDQPARGTRIDCFAEMATCEHARRQGRDVRGSGTTTCRRYTRHPPYRLLNQTTPPPARDGGSP